MSLDEQLDELVKLATRRHYWCDDSYYSCPASEEGCSDPAYEDTKECQCGADEHNAKVVSLAAKIKERQMRTLCRQCGSPVQVNGVGFFEAMRRAHPLRIGDCIEGKRIVVTFWEWSPENGNVPMYRLDGETTARVAS